jgi:hypothetical protein
VSFIVVVDAALAVGAALPLVDDGRRAAMVEEKLAPPIPLLPREAIEALLVETGSTDAAAPVCC